MQINYHFLHAIIKMHQIVMALTWPILKQLKSHIKAKFDRVRPLTLEII